jgi:hypothetical protein
VPRGHSIARVTVPALRLPPDAALPVLLHARHDAAHPAAAFWAAAAIAALDLVARRRIHPDAGAWRAGPLKAADLDHVAALADAMPAEARAIPLPGTLHLPDAAGLIHAFLDAVADAMAPRPAETLAPRISLRAELPDPAAGELRLVLQVHSPADPALVTDAAALWAGTVHGFGPRTPMEVTLAVRHAAQAWPTLDRLLHRPVPDALTLTDEETTDLLGDAARRRADAGPRHSPAT